ncbi:hypothetical protein [Haloarchaeobius sp. TZWWS8]|uniref:hypothetical protein n=1 Tax=Haloarchaeobius sp. TZWWS8 TaxID=3446121 RepID=UPI003EBE390B
MTEERSQPRQWRFQDGELVEPAAGSHDDDPTRADPVVPNERTGFSVAVKQGALDANQTLARDVDSVDEVLEFGSRAEAEAYAIQLSAGSGGLRVQAAAGNDPTGVDAYLLAAHAPSITEPATTEGETWTFDVGANLYGTLGEAVIVDGAKPHAIEHFVREDLAVSEDELEQGLRVQVESGWPICVETGEGTETWVPDCVVEVHDGWNGPELANYYAEIKTGDASFQRSQSAVMKALAVDERVLKIRVRIEDLPDQYAVRIQEVGE